MQKRLAWTVNGNLQILPIGVGNLRFVGVFLVCVLMFGRGLPVCGNLLKFNVFAHILAYDFAFAAAAGLAFGLA